MITGISFMPAVVMILFAALLELFPIVLQETLNSGSSSARLWLAAAVRAKLQFRTRALASSNFPPSLIWTDCRPTSSVTILYFGATIFSYVTASSRSPTNMKFWNTFSSVTGWIVRVLLVVAVLTRAARRASKYTRRCRERVV